MFHSTESVSAIWNYKTKIKLSSSKLLVYRHRLHRRESDQWAEPRRWHVHPTWFLLSSLGVLQRRRHAAFLSKIFYYSLGRNNLCCSVPRYISSGWFYSAIYCPTPPPPPPPILHPPPRQPISCLATIILLSLSLSHSFFLGFSSVFFSSTSTSYHQEVWGI
jgi:hypothetical protein